MVCIIVFVEPIEPQNWMSIILIVLGKNEFYFYFFLGEKKNERSYTNGVVLFLIMSKEYLVL